MDLAMSVARGRSRATVRLFGALASVTYRPAAAEVARRRDASVGAFTRLDLLDVLMGLPVGLPVECGGLAERERRLLREVPKGAVEVGEGVLIRRAVAPLVVDHAIVTARSWKSGMRKAGRLAPFCSRALRLLQPPADLDDAVAQANFYGIGILIGPPNSADELVAPEPYIRRRHTASQWWFAETVFSQLGPTT